MQNTELVQWLFLKCGLGGGGTQEDLCVLSYNFTDILDFRPRLRQVIETHPCKVGKITDHTPSQGIRRRDSPPCTTLVLVCDISHAEKRLGRLLRVSSSAESGKHSSRGSVADDCGLQQILAIILLQCIKRQQVQNAIGHDDEPFASCDLTHRP